MVEPKGIRRFALTCRNILMEKLPSDEARADADAKAELPARAQSSRITGTRCDIWWLVVSLFSSISFPPLLFSQ